MGFISTYLFRLLGREEKNCDWSNDLDFHVCRSAYTNRLVDSMIFYFNKLPLKSILFISNRIFPHVIPHTCYRLSGEHVEVGTRKYIGSWEKIRFFKTKYLLLCVKQNKVVRE